MNNYDPLWVANYYDNLGLREWYRLKRSPVDEVKLHVHTHYLHEHVKRGDYVLEIGAGAGRFTQVLAKIGARVVVADISPRQLAINRRHASRYGFKRSIDKWLQLDICNMRALQTKHFDVVVCYGGPLSYVFDRRDAAMRELLRVLKDRGTALLSVMTLWGSVHFALPSIATVPIRENALVIRTGDQTPHTFKAGRHFCHFFRADEFRAFLAKHQTRIQCMSASNCISTAWNQHLATLRKNPSRWKELLAMELEACCQPGCLDMGTHLIAVVKKRPRTAS